MKRQALVVALVAALGVGTAAQQPPPGAQGGNPTKAEGTVLKNRAPVNKEVLRVTLPKPKEADLSNGVHLLVLEDHRTPQINFSDDHRRRRRLLRSGADRRAGRLRRRR